MDIHNLWNDDPEEVLFDLGFGCDEPDISGRIPARFINHPSQARGINLQVFLEAQKNRHDLENPDVISSFRQLEVLQQVTTAFSSLMDSSSSKDLLPEAQERRRRVEILFRRASKSLRQIKSQDTITPAATSSALAPESPYSIGDSGIPLKRPKHGCLDTEFLSPLAEEKEAGPEPQAEPHVPNSIAQEGVLMHRPLPEGQPQRVDSVLLRKKSPGPARESLEMEENIFKSHCFDESIPVSDTGTADHSAQDFTRTNSCQSDSSGFLEEPIVPSVSQQPSPGSALTKIQSGMSEENSERLDSPNPPLLVYSSLLPSDSPLFYSPPLSPVTLGLSNSDSKKLQDQDQSGLMFEYLCTRSSSPELQDVTHPQYPLLLSFVSPTSPPIIPPQSGSEDKHVHPSQSDSSCGSPEQTDVGLHGDSVCASSLFPSAPSHPPSNCHYPSSLASPPRMDSFSQSQDSDGLDLSDPPTSAAVKEEETSFQSDEDTPSALSPLVMDSSEFRDCDPSRPGLCPNLSIPVCQSLDVLYDLADPPDYTDHTPASLIQDVNEVEMNHLTLDVEVSHQKSENSDSVQTQKAFTNTERAAGLSPASRLVSEEVCDPTKKECQREVNGSLDLHNGGLESYSRDEVQAKGLIQIESLDLVFQIPVDELEDESDVEAFFRQLDSEGKVYWAEPIQVSNPSPSLDEFGVDSPSPADERSLPDRSMSSSLSSLTADTEQVFRDANSDPPTATTPNLRISNCSDPVQMSSSLSSHIVHRKDVPYTIGSKSSLPPGVLPLDTSSPFRAVQSWTELQIQRNTLARQLSHGALQSALEEETAERTQRPVLNFWQSRERLPARHQHLMSVPVDPKQWPDEEDEGRLWQDEQTASIACCCSCDHQCSCCSQKTSSIPISMDELEEMMLCLQQFRSILSNMEEQLSEDQAEVYSCLSDQEREKIEDIEELRLTVKQEAAELTKQLNELALHYDGSLKMKIHRLLDEQSLLCSQLRVSLPGPDPRPQRSAATQCCLLMPPAEVYSWSSPGSQYICESPGCPPTKTDKVDMMRFLHRLKESLHHSVNTDSSE